MQAKKQLKQTIFLIVLIYGTYIAQNFISCYGDKWKYSSSQEAELNSVSEEEKTEDEIQLESENICNYSDISGLNVTQYNGVPYVDVNNNIPMFDDDTTITGEYYSELDCLDRCGVAYACVGPETLPIEERQPIGNIKPTGWHTVKYNDIIEGNYLYNRCHLIAYCLTGENANEKNLVTGTRYMNVEGMLPFELKVCNYVEETGNHVFYRATPVFKGDNMVCDGVLLEAQSVEDEAISFCVFCFNVQPGVKIDYQTGESKRADSEDKEK